MIDVVFYQRVNELKKQIMAGRMEEVNLDQYRSEYPCVFNIETTNACTMTCPFCPRTSHMTRPVKTMDKKTFENIAKQLTPHPFWVWDNWVKFARENYQVPIDEQSENAFFLYILPRVIVLHGYGDPLLDPHIPEYVGMLTKRGLQTYFSCNPANIQLDKTQIAFENGLSYIKYSIDSLTKSARGRDAFAKDYPLIMKVLEMKERLNYKTQVIITMIDLGQGDEYDQLKEAFRDTGVYIYKKSLDQSWLTGADAPKSIHWSEFCQIPWSSMTINSSGLAVMCEEDYDGSVVLGDTHTESLHDIWNGEKYAAFRKSHMSYSEGQCWDTCDMRTVGEYL